MDKLINRLHRYIGRYGIQDSRTIAVSQKIDVLIVQKQKALRAATQSA